MRQKPFLQLDQLGLEVLLADLVGVSPITQLKGAEEDGLDRSGNLPTTVSGGLQQLVAAR